MDEGSYSALNVRRQPFKLARSVVEPERNAVRPAEGSEQLLEPKVMDVLSVLAAHPGEVLSREDIVNTVWGRSFGTDESLTRAISILRKTLVPGDGRLIETVAKRGYRLEASVLDVDRPPDARMGVPVAIELRAYRSKRWMAWAIGLILLVGVAAWMANRFFSAQTEAPAITIRVEASPATAELSAKLSESLARTPLFQVRAGGPAGTADYLVKVLPAAGNSTPQVRVLLVGEKSNNLLWSTTFIPSGAEGAQLRSTGGQLVNRILTAAKRDLRARPVEQLNPWQLILLGTWVPGDDEVFLQPHGPNSFYLQRRALQLDPKYAPAHASLAKELAYHALFDSRREAGTRLKEAELHAQRARSLAPYDPGVLYELATYKRLIGDREQAVAGLGRVLQLQPDHPLALTDQVFVEALCTPRAASASQGLRDMLGATAPDDPVRWVMLSHIADLQLSAGNWAGAAQAAKASRDIVHQTWSGLTLAAASAADGRAEQAQLAARETRLEWPNLDWRWFAGNPLNKWCLGGEAHHPRAAFAQLARASTSVPSKK
jgi:DNA-binding winged helix-turn-helix (wHTH) protein/tetratricopeptide (TPR) repeat protein